MQIGELIEKEVDEWQTKTIDEVWAELNDLVWQYLDNDNYTWGGVADVLGNSGTEALRSALENNGSKWAVYALGGQPGLQLTRPEIQEALYLFEAAGLVPNSSKLAKHVKRVVSLLELHKLSPSKDLVATVLSGMQLGAIKREKKVIASSRYNAYCAAMEAWDGNPDTEPTL
jgi:hypothetical protein